jgi:hypothetical protein
VIAIIVYFGCFAGGSTKIDTSSNSIKVSGDANNQTMTIETKKSTYTVKGLDSIDAEQDKNSNLI